jgi:hypothetical protein
LELTLGYRTWFSWAGSDDTVLLDGVSSKFKFGGVYSTVYEFNTDAVWRDRWLLRVDIGFAAIDEGSFREVVTPADEPADAPGDIESDGLFYVTADAGCRVFRRCRPDRQHLTAYLDLLAGYQNWRETYEPFSNTVAQFTDRYTWDSIRVGGRGVLETCRWTLQGRVLFVPWARFESNASPGAVNLDYTIKADGGFGVMSDVTFSYWIGRGLALEAGYQVFHLGSGDGTFRTRRGFTAPFDEAHSTRHGILLGVNWRF